MNPVHSKRSPWQIAAQLLWLVLVLLQVVVIILGLPELSTAARQICTDTVTICQSRMQLMPEQAALWSLDAYARYVIITRTLARLVSFLLGLLLFAKKPTSRIAWITSLYLIIGVETGISSALALAHSAWLPVTLGLEFVVENCLVLFFLLFPNERFAPRWTRWFPWVYAPLSAAGVIFWQLLVSGSLDPETTARVESMRMIQGVLLLGLILVLVGIIIYRYRAVFTYPERQKTKWVIYAFSLGYGIFVIYIFLNLALGWESLPRPPWLYMIEDFFIVGIIDYLIPIAITIAILQHRLFDIDLIIRKTLQYSALSVLLALAYFGGVVVLQGILRPLTGAGNTPLVIVVTTLGIAALFNPLRRRVQEFIDHRFYRRKYDAEKMLQAFAQSVRNEMDLDTLTAELAHLAQETMQPTLFSVWIKDTRRGGGQALADEVLGPFGSPERAEVRIQ